MNAFFLFLHLILFASLSIAQRSVKEFPSELYISVPRYCKLLLSDLQFIKFITLNESTFDTLHARLHFTLKRHDSVPVGKQQELKILIKMVKERIERKIAQADNAMNNLEGYTTQVMEIIKNSIPVMPEPDFERQRAHIAPIPILHINLLKSLESRNSLFSADFITDCEDAYRKTFRNLRKSGVISHQVHFTLNGALINKFLLENFPFFSNITSSWIRLWIMGVCLAKNLPNASGKNNMTVGELLIYDFENEVITAKSLTLKEGYRDLEFSCLHMDFLMACMRFGIKFDLLTPMQHLRCLNNIQQHREICLQFK